MGACNVSEKHYHLHMDTVIPKLPSGHAEAESLSRPAGHVASVPCLRSQELFGRTREILIEHGGAYYRLRLTHSNKLILTK